VHIEKVIFEAVYATHLLKPPCRSLVRALELGLVPPEYVEKAYQILEYNHRAHYGRRPRGHHKDYSPNQDPSWDNLIRVMEEDC
jgi:hypothetical protein